MSQYIYILIAAGIIVVVFWISITTAMKEAARRGAAEADAKASEEARKVEQEMADEIATPVTAEEVKDRFRRGDI